MPDFVLGIDWGSRRIGLALGQTLTGQARPLKTIPNNTEFSSQLDQTIEEWQITQLIIGLPLDEGGDEQEITRRVKNFGQALAKRTRLPVHYIDERYTSFAAERAFQSRRAASQVKAKDKDQIDAMAAQIILQSWLDEQRPNFS